MGGMGSGQSGGRPTVEGCISLDVSKLMRNENLRRNGRSVGTMSWSWGNQNKASIGFAVSLGEDSGLVSLLYTTTDRETGEHRKHDRTISLETTPQPFGGRRWYFVCPITGRRVLKLYMPAGRVSFASREAYRMGYSSQRQSPRDRATARAFRLRRRLGDDHGGIGDPVYKPKWMRWATYERERDRIYAVEEICEDHLMGAFERLFGKRLQSLKA